MAPWLSFKHNASFAPRQREEHRGSRASCGSALVTLTETSAAAATVITPTIRRTAFFAATDLNDMESFRLELIRTEVSQEDRRLLRYGQEYMTRSVTRQ